MSGPDGNKAGDPRANKRCAVCHATKTVTTNGPGGPRQVPCPACNGKGVGPGLMTK